jgi:hypothetical protein
MRTGIFRLQDPLYVSFFHCKILENFCIATIQTVRGRFWRMRVQITSQFQFPKKTAVGTDAMASLHDVIVLGAGVQGSATAYYLTQKAGVEGVLLLEQVNGD